MAQPQVSDVLTYAEQQLGKPYVFGTAGPSQFDCSGLVKYVFGHYGISLPHYSEDQATHGTSVPTNQIQPGDLVFSDWGDGPNSHVGIAVTPSKIIDAPHTGAVVRYDDLNSGYLSHVTAVRRLDLAGGEGQAGQTITSGITIPGVGDISDFLQPFKDIAHAAATGENIANKALSLFAPSNFIRVIAGLGGVILILIGIWFLSREIRN